MLKSTSDFNFSGCGATCAAARPLLLRLVVFFTVFVICLMPLSSFALSFGHGHFDRALIVLEEGSNSADKQHNNHHKNNFYVQIFSNDCCSTTGDGTSLKHCAQACFNHCQSALIADFTAPDNSAPDKFTSLLAPDWRSFYPALQKPPPRKIS